jgi:hypothetical protein
MNKLFIVVFVVAIGASYGLFLDNVSSFLLGCIFSILVPFKRILRLNILLQLILCGCQIDGSKPSICFTAFFVKVHSIMISYPNSCSYCIFLSL